MQISKEFALTISFEAWVEVVNTSTHTRFSLRSEYENKPAGKIAQFKINTEMGFSGATKSQRENYEFPSK